MRLPEPAEEDAEHGVGVGGGADRGAGVGAHPLLVDDDRGRQSLEDVDLGPRQRRHETLHEGAVGLVDQPLRLRGDRAEHQGGLARAGDAGEHRQPALGDLDAEVLEVVLARAVHADQIVAVGNVPRGRCASVLLAMLIGLHLGGPPSVSIGVDGHSTVLEQPEHVAVRVDDGGDQAAAPDVVRGLLHGGTRRGHLGQLGLDVGHVPEATGEVMPCVPHRGTSPMCWPAASKPT